MSASPERKFLQYEWLAYQYASRLSKQLRIEYDDALAWGRLGLWQAVHSEDQGHWLLYARTRVQGAIRDGARLWHGRYNPKRQPPLFVHMSERYEPSFTPEEPKTYSKLLKALGELTERERDVLAAHFFTHEKQADVALRYNVSFVRISQIKSAALRRLRDILLGLEPSKRRVRPRKQDS